MLAAHPELRELAGPTPSTAFWILALVVIQFGLAFVVGDRSWMIWVPVAYVAGATIDHALWVLIHETCHNLVFRSRTANRLVAILANLPLVVPGAIAFGKYHLLHHRHMGDLDFDAGIPGPDRSARDRPIGGCEGRVGGRDDFIQGIVRPSRHEARRAARRLDDREHRHPGRRDGAHRVRRGRRAVQVPRDVDRVRDRPAPARRPLDSGALRAGAGQETYSYYGPLNKVSFNVGYHNEHHDIVNVPWSRLPQIRRIAPEFYDGLHSYSSWTALLVRFVRDSNITLYNAIVRPGRP